MIELKEVKSKKELKLFVTFPFTLYKDSKYWVPPIVSDEMETLNAEKNPAFESAQAKFYLAYRNHKIVGRVAAIINSIEINEQGVKKMRFGWFDVIDDLDVSRTLLNQVETIGKQNGLDLGFWLMAEMVHTCLNDFS